MILLPARDTPWPTVALCQNALAITAFLGLAAVAWVALLRRQLELRTRDLRRTRDQLETARLGAEEALQRARKAETLEQQKKAVMELIACDEPLQTVMDEIAGAIEKQCNGRCCIRLEGDECGHAGAAPSLPAAWRQAVEQLDVGSIRVGVRTRSLREFSPESNWAEFIAARQPPEGQTVFALPVLSGPRRAGVISVFFERARRVTDHEAALLSSWSGVAAMALDRRRLHDQLAFRAWHDELTGLANRALLFERLRHEVQRCHDNGTALAVLYLDLDGFKAINDRLGHAAGDDVLRQQAERLRLSVRKTDTIARVGGDEFVVLLPDLRDASDATSLAQVVIRAIEAPIYWERERLICGASAGWSLFPRDGDDVERLLRIADGRMYEHKALLKLRKGNQSAQRLLEPAPASYFIG